MSHDTALRPVTHTSFRVWGTTAEFHVTDTAALVPGRLILEEVLAGVDTACSRFREDSELTRANRADGAAVPASPLFLEALSVAMRAAELTDGAVDPTCGKALNVLGYDRDYAAVRASGAPSSKPRPAPGWRIVRVDWERGTVQVPGGVLLDLGATAKAFAADRAAARIAADLGCGVLVNLGGDIAVAGPSPTDGWPVRITEDHLADDDSEGQTVAVRDGAVATSSTVVRTWRHGHRRVHHIIDPRTGDMATPFWRTVSATAATCVDANTLTTGAIVKGEDALGWLEDSGCPVRLIRHDGVIVRLGGWPEETSWPEETL